MIVDRLLRLQHQIVVVAGGVARSETEPELKKLDSIPTFAPILKNTATSQLQHQDLLEKIDTQAVSTTHCPIAVFGLHVRFLLLM